MEKKLSNKISRMVNEEYSKQLNEMKFMGEEFTWDDVKRAALAAGFSAAMIASLMTCLQSEADENADMERYEQSDEGRRDFETTKQMFNGNYDGLDECIHKTIKNTLKRFN